MESIVKPLNGKIGQRNCFNFKNLRSGKGEEII